MKIPRCHIVQGIGISLKVPTLTPEIPGGRCMQGCSGHAGDCTLQGRAVPVLQRRARLERGLGRPEAFGDICDVPAGRFLRTAFLVYLVPF